MKEVEKSRRKLREAVKSGGMLTKVVLGWEKLKEVEWSSIKLREAIKNWEKLTEFAESWKTLSQK